MKEKDIKIYYTSGQKKAQIEPFIQQILSASCLTDAIEAYLNMKACISPKWVKEYLDKPIILNGRSIKFKDLPIFKRLKEEARKYVINKLCSEGKCVIMVSSELPEILGMSDRVIVMREGKVMGELDRDSEFFNQESIMKAAWGGTLS